MEIRNGDIGFGQSYLNPYVNGYAQAELHTLRYKDKYSTIQHVFTLWPKEREILAAAGSKTSVFVKLSRMMRQGRSNIRVA